MFNRFRNVLYNVVGGIDPLPVLKDAESSAEDTSTLKPKFPYTRPHFLQFHSDEEIQWSACHNIRPIIVPRDITKIPWNSGYAEAVNAGKSRWNEDQACIQKGFLQRPESRGRCTTPTITQDTGSLIPDHLNAATYLPYVYFAMFDGHAGVGAAVAAANQLHHILQEKLIDVIDHLLPPLDDLPEHLMEKTTRRGACMWFPGKDVTQESLIIGALESSFWDMDQLIAEDRQKYDMKGGCTALVALFILGKVYVANAGDSRAVLCRNDVAIPLSNDFTPETERQRIRRLASLQPELLGADFTYLDYCRRPSEKDLGKRILYRDVFMTGWAYKTVTKADLKCPVVTGEGKRSRVLATIGVTRGFGDHDLRALYCNNPIKPFLLSQPEVQVLDLSTITENDVLVMGTDGLWDVTSNDKAAEIVQKSLCQFSLTEDTRLKYRYTSAAQDLVMHSRGKLQERNWRTADGKAATIDDISVFIIPLIPYREEYVLWKNYYDAIHGLYDNTTENTNLGQLTLKTSPTIEKVSNVKSNSSHETEEVVASTHNHHFKTETKTDVQEPGISEKDILKDMAKLEITSTHNAVVEGVMSHSEASLHSSLLSGDALHVGASSVMLAPLYAGTSSRISPSSYDGTFSNAESSTCDGTSSHAGPLPCDDTTSLHSRPLLLDSGTLLHSGTSGARALSHDGTSLSVGTLTSAGTLSSTGTVVSASTLLSAGDPLSSASSLSASAAAAPLSTGVLLSTGTPQSPGAVLSADDSFLPTGFSSTGASSFMGTSRIGVSLAAGVSTLPEISQEQMSSHFGLSSTGALVSAERHHSDTSNINSVLEIDRSSGDTESGKRSS